MKLPKPDCSVIIGIPWKPSTTVIVSLTKTGGLFATEFPIVVLIRDEAVFATAIDRFQRRVTRTVVLFLNTARPPNGNAEI